MSRWYRWHEEPPPSTEKNSEIPVDNNPRDGVFSRVEKKTPGILYIPRWDRRRAYCNKSCVGYLSTYEKKIFNSTYGENKTWDQIKSGSQVESVERKSIHLSTDEDLMNIVWTASHKIDLAIIVDTSQQPFSSYTFPKMKVLFGLKADSYVELPRFTGGISEINKALRDDVIKDILEIHMASPSI
ncbi:10458_t:CDS:2, partial [Dentiscutata heterogama]